MSLIGAYFPLKVKLELRAITNKDRIFDSAVIISSVIPSAKNSCSRPPVKFANGRTAMDGLSGNVSTGAATLLATVERSGSP